jgi:hypothetical protein
MAELGATRRYTYWSDRAVQRVADDNGIRLGPAWRLAVKSPAVGPMPQVEATQAPRRLTRHEIARKIERAIGRLAVQDFVTPPPASFAKGTSLVTLAVYMRRPFGEYEDKGVILHTSVKATDDTRVEICLFGSLDNLIGMNTPEERVLQTSSIFEIERFIRDMGLMDPLPEDRHVQLPIHRDDQEIAVRILGFLTMESVLDIYGFTAPDLSEWFAQVYKDVELDKSRWDYPHPGGLPQPVDRIIIGAPLWVRSS